MAVMRTMYRMQNRTSATMGREDHARSESTRRKQLYHTYIQRRKLAGKFFTPLCRLSEIYEATTQENARQILHVWGIRRGKWKTSLPYLYIWERVSTRQIQMEKNEKWTPIIQITPTRKPVETWG